MPVFEELSRRGLQSLAESQIQSINIGDLKIEIRLKLRNGRELELLFDDCIYLAGYPYCVGRRIEGVRRINKPELLRWVLSNAREAIDIDVPEAEFEFVQFYESEEIYFDLIAASVKVSD